MPTGLGQSLDFSFFLLANLPGPTLRASRGTWGISETGEFGLRAIRDLSDPEYHHLYKF